MSINVQGVAMNLTLANSNETKTMGGLPLHILQENTLETRRIILHPIEQKDLPLLHKWRNNPMFINLCSVRRNIISFEEFVSELRHDFERDRHIQCIIALKGKEIPIGTIFSYSFNLTDGYVFITIYISEEYQSKGYGVEAIALFIRYLFNFFPTNKIYMETYGYNQLSLSPLRNFGFQEEGRFKEHRFFNGSRHDLIRFAIFRADLERISTLIRRLTKTSG